MYAMHVVSMCVLLQPIEQYAKLVANKVQVWEVQTCEENRHHIIYIIKLYEYIFEEMITTFFGSRNLYYWS